LNAPQPDRSTRVSVQTVEASEAGRLEVKGFAEANATIRLYLNGSFLADALAGPKGLWSLTIERGMAPGRYDVRADQINSANGAVLARAEVPFAYPQHPGPTGGPLASARPPQPATETPRPAPAIIVASQNPGNPPREPPAAAPVAQAQEPPPPAPMASQRIAAAPDAPAAKPDAPASSTPAAMSDALASSTPAIKPDAVTSSGPAAAKPTENARADVVISEVRTATVVRGDSLWRLSQRHYRDGMRYRQIYVANASQIRNPNLIYPGQIFVIPKTPPT
jgi:nucleoid-associated protein YgaU